MLAAARALVEKGGISAATIDAIAARSGVAKTTIYRRWPNRTALLVDLLTEVAAAALPLPKGRDPMRAMRDELRRGARAAEGLSGRLLISLLGVAQGEPEARAALLRSVLLPRREARIRAIRQAQASGVLRDDVAPNVAVDMLWGPLFYRMWVRHEPVTVSFVTQVFENVLAGLEASPRAGKTRRRTGRRKSAAVR